MTYSIGPIRRCILLGGTPLLLRLARECRKKDLEVLIITSPRHAAEIVESNKTFEQLCRDEKFVYIVTHTIDSSEIREAVGSMEHSVALCKAGAWLFTQKMIDEIFQGKLLNSHGTRLPVDRGGGGFSWQIMRGDRKGICLVHLIDEGVDTGGILATQEFDFPASCRLPKDYDAYHDAKNLAFISAMLDDMHKSAKKYEVKAQDESKSSYNPRLHTLTHGWIDWNWTADEIERFACAFDAPYAGAQTRWNGAVVHIRNVFAKKPQIARHPFESGIIFRKDEHGAWVVAREGDLLVTDVEDENGKSILANINVGDRLITTSEDLGKAKQRVVYDAKGVRK
jgi:methionyl-tRNA formyltransferase